ncbi:CHAT domain-containing protein [Streptomyces sp. NRRL S-237]|uniref:CHAT domain-containing protein n=1 Tax=Streptomyces sp. NRRL S-237 TaxID=1463895 RepID=UPI00131DF393|nr:CHAT domain-containing protein [Streptomyces sp. NRRL S-237]
MEIADEFAQGYAPMYRPELLIRLLENGGLVQEQRHALAEETYQVAFEAGRLREALKALLELIRLRHQHARPDAARKISESAAAACDLIQDSLERAQGTADLIDIAQSLTATSSQLAGLLALQGYGEWAFKVAHAPIGAISRAFVQNPDLVQEYELAEQRQHRGTPDVSQQLFVMMLDRLRTGGESHRSKDSPNLADVAAPFGSSVTMVQLLHTPQHGSWALGANVTNGECRYWSCRIAVSLSLLNLLRESIDAWVTSQHGQDNLLEDLRLLHAKVVRPWIGRIAAAATVVFIPHRAFSGLPLHAALRPDGYLVEQYRVGYLPNFESPPSGASIPQTAFMGGWDNAIKAVDEVRVLTPKIEDEFGFDVVSPQQVTDARECLLADATKWGIVHIAAHGEFHRWPLASTSKLRLLDGVTLSASEWLHSGCGASLIFLNVCTVGRQAPHAGDLNGFPLALRVRGAVAEVSCLTPVTASAAYEFAVTFYGKFASHDTLTAYQLACRDAISGGKPARNWVPYLHVGFPVSLNTTENVGASKEESPGRGQTEITTLYPDRPQH